MILSERVKKLRDQSLNAVEKISAERALLITQFYKSDEARELSAPVKRAKAFAPIASAFTGAFSTPPEALTWAPTYFIALVF